MSDVLPCPHYSPNARFSLKKCNSSDRGTNFRGSEFVLPITGANLDRSTTYKTRKDMSDGISY